MSTGFNFGAKPGAPAFGQTNFGGQQPTGSITFGTPVATNTAAPLFGTNTQSPSLFGTPAKTTPSFGASPGLSFGSSLAPTTGLGFGAPNVTVSTSGGFGTSTTPGLSFGQALPTGTSFTLGPPASSAPNSGLTFGGSYSVAPNTGLSFGMATSAPTGLSFGSVTTTAPTLSFGATPSSTGSTFGAGTTGASTGLSFGSTAPTGTGISFGGPTSTGSTGLTFGTPSTSALTFGGTGGLTFGPTTTTTSTVAPSLGLNFGTTTTSTLPSFSFGTPSATTGTTSLNFGLGTTTTPSTGLNFGLGGGTSTGLTFTTKPTTTTTAIVGLGGIATSTHATSTSSGKTEVLPRDQPLPNEILQNVESFKTFVKQQKSYSSDVARCSVKEFKKVAADISSVGSLLNEVEKQLQTNRAIAEKLKYDSAKVLQNVEIAQRTSETPPGLQYENTAPMNFFLDLVANFEMEMQNLKLQIENTDKYVKNLGKPSPLNSQDLALGMRRLHETFVALAGRLQSVHNQVESQKEHYLTFRKYMLHDDTNVFEKPGLQADALTVALNSISYKPPAFASGPTPFNSLSHPSVVQAAVQNQASAIAGTSTLSLGTTQAPPAFGAQTSSQGIFGNTSSLGGGSTFGQQPLQFSSPSTNFQLQKPPVGNKRGKQ